MTDFLIEILLGDALPKADRLDARALTLLETAVTHTLNHQQAPPPSSLTVLLSDDSYIHSLNRDFMGQDKPTDVLSFPAGDPLPGGEGSAVYLGDIAISVPFAERQAAVSGHELLAELQLLVIHGALHLLGHDHAGADEKRVMWRAQTAVLAQLGLSHIAPTEA